MAARDILTHSEYALVKRRIAECSAAVNDLLDRIDLYVNSEGYPKDANFLPAMWRRLQKIMRQGERYRDMFWRHMVAVDCASAQWLSAEDFIVSQIKNRVTHSRAYSCIKSNQI